MQKAHNDARKTFYHRKISTFQVRKSAYRKHLVKNCGKSFAPPQKISKAPVTNKAENVHKTTFIITFAASGDILKGRQPLKAAFFGTFFAEAKKVRPVPRTAGTSRRAAANPLRLTAEKFL